MTGVDPTGLSRLDGLVGIKFLFRLMRTLDGVLVAVHPIQRLAFAESYCLPTSLVVHVAFLTFLTIGLECGW